MAVTTNTPWPQIFNTMVQGKETEVTLLAWSKQAWMGMKGWETTFVQNLPIGALEKCCEQKSVNIELTLLEQFSSNVGCNEVSYLTSYGND